MKLWGRRLWTLLSGPRGRMGVSQGWAFNSWKLHSSLTGLLSATGVVSQWTQVFEERGIPEARESSEYIVAHVLGAKTFQSLKPELWTKPLTPEQLQCIQELCSHRLQRMPVQYILGEWDFQGLSLKMVPPVFIPRPETESWEIENGLWREVGLPTRWCSSLSCILNSKSLILDHYEPQFRLQELVEWVLGEVAQRPPAVGAQGGPLILEVGCGSGAIALSLLSQLPESQVIAVDKEEAAVSLTRENAQRLQLQDRIRIIPLDVTSEGCWTHLVPWGPVDLVVSNPPYIFHKDMEQLAPEICSYEDLVALDGGEEGMDIISRILTLAPRLLSASGSIFLEVDPRHPELVKSWLQSRPDLHLSLVAVRKDFCGRLRFLHVQKFAP